MINQKNYFSVSARSSLHKIRPTFAVFMITNLLLQPNMGHRREKRFNIRARLFIGSLPNEVDEDWLRELFKPHSDVSEVFLHKEKGFGFVRCVSYGGFF